MTLPELIRDLCEYLQLDALAPDREGIYALVFDGGLEVEILALGSSQLLVRHAVAEVPDQEWEQEEFLRKCLQHNLCNLRRQNAVLSLDVQNRRVWLHRIERMADFNARTLCEILEDFVNSAEWWDSVQVTPPASAPLPFSMLRP